MNHTGLELVFEWFGYRMPLMPPAVVSYVVEAAILPAAAAWKVGGDAAKQPQGFELPAWIAILATWTACGLYAKLQNVEIFLPLLFVLGGTLRVRWQDVKAASH